MNPMMCGDEPWLVTGGAGYVGSHCARRLVQEGIDVITFDDLSSGHVEAVSGRFVHGDILDVDALTAALTGGVAGVLHFAARAEVGGSHRDPAAYWHTNVGGTAALLRAMAKAGVRRLVVSSTCSVYGEPGTRNIVESAPFSPLSPYGETKAAMERMVDASISAGLVDAIRLRYFNAAGASSDGWLGEAHDPETHLIPRALEAAMSRRPIQVFGLERPTPDGTCVRDFVHVEDLADAHLAALLRLQTTGESAVYNLGSGRGYSVREVLDTIAGVVGDVPWVAAPARAGDPARLVANSERALAELAWRPTRDLRQIVADAWRWHCAPRFGPRSGANPIPPSGELTEPRAEHRRPELRRAAQLDVATPGEVCVEEP